MTIQRLGVYRCLLMMVAPLLLAAAALAVASTFAPWELTLGNIVVRTQRGTTFELPPPAAGARVSGGRRTQIDRDGENPPRNVILVIGDGMGLGQISSASYLINGPDGALGFEKAPITGLVKTHAGDVLVTDSAAASTAMATGFKAPKKAISVLADGRRAMTLFEAARARGLATGVVTTSGLFDATPAGFTAHAEKRNDYEGILEAMITSGSEVLIGGDWSGYEWALKDSDFQDSLHRIDARAAAAGYTVVRNIDELETAVGPVLALFPLRPDIRDAHGPPLEALALDAVNRLAGNTTGFILVVESEVTDGEGHANRLAGVVEGVRELDRTVAELRSWAGQRGDTLIVVTADHDTGGVGIVDGRYDDGTAIARWASTGHTAQWVPLFAFGPGSDRFTGVMDNTEIGLRIADLLGFEGFPRTHP